MDDVFRISSLVRRVASRSEGLDYLTEMEEIVDLSDARDEILNRVSNVITQVNLQAALCIHCHGNI